MTSLFASFLLVVVVVVSIEGCPHLRSNPSNDLLPLDSIHRKLQSTPTFAPTKRRNPTFAPTYTATAVPTTHTSSPTTSTTAFPTVSGAAITSAYCLKTNGAAAVATKANTCSAYTGIKSAFDTLVTNAGTGLLNRANLVSAPVRLAFHDAGEVDVTSTDLFGPDGCLSSVDDNNGLIESTSLVYTTLEPIWQQYCDQISRADFWALFAKLAIEEADPTDTISINYQYGRKDISNCQGGAKRLPDADKGLDEINQVFVNQMGLTLDDAVTLVGAHTLGYVHIENSGYGYSGSTASGRLNAWDDTPADFDNHFFSNLMGVNWRNGRTTSGMKTQWNAGPAPTIMLSADVALGYVPDLTSNDGLGTLNQACGPWGLEHNTKWGCSPLTTTKPSTYNLSIAYAYDNSLFLTNFATSFTKMMTVGYGVPAAVDGATASGKLGTLTAIDLSTC